MANDQKGKMQQRRPDDRQRPQPGQQRRTAPLSRLQRARSSPSVTDLRDYLATLDTPVTASVHVNGPQFPSAILSVDFGQPLKPARLESAQQGELVERMRRAACDILGRDQSIMISADHHHGIWWAAIG